MRKFLGTLLLSSAIFFCLNTGHSVSVSATVNSNKIYQKVKNQSFDHIYNVYASSLNRQSYEKIYNEIYKSVYVAMIQALQEQGVSVTSVSEPNTGSHIGNNDWHHQPTTTTTTSTTTTTIFTHYTDSYKPFQKNGKWGFTDANGNYTVSPIYQEVRMFREGLAAVKLNNLWGFINGKGKVVVEIKYFKVTDFVNGVAYGYRSQNDNRPDKFFASNLER